MRFITVGLAISDDKLRAEVRASAQTLGLRIALEQGHPVETLHLKRWKPDLMLIGDAGAVESLEEQVRRIKAVAPGTLVAVVHPSVNTDMVLESMRAGVDEYIPSPVSSRLPEAIARMSEHVARRSPANRPAGKLVGLVSAQGGCGTTTIACHVAVDLERAKRQHILLADLDLESGLVAFLMKTGGQFSVLDAVKNLYRLDPSLWHGMVANAQPYLDVIPSPGGLAITDAADPTQFHEVFGLVRSLYGLVMLDLGRTMNPITLMMLDDLDELYLVATPSITALYQAKRFVQRAVDAGYPRNKLRLILNRLPKQLSALPAELEQTFGVWVCAHLPDRPEVEDAYRVGALLPPNSTLGRHFAKLARLIEGTREEPATGGFSWFGLKRSQANYQVT